jgi:hypothetical protein
MAKERNAPDAAIRLAECVLRMRVEIRKLAFDSSGRVDSALWAEMYDLMREFEDAEVNDMIAGVRRKEERNDEQKRRDERRKRIRQATDLVVVEKKRPGQHKGKHPWRTKASR